MAVDGVTVEYRDPRPRPERGRRDPGRAGPRARLRRPARQRLARGQPVHRRREPARAPPRRGAVRQRTAARGHRAQEPGRRERHDRVGAPAATDLRGGGPLAVRLQRRARRVGRARSPHRHADRRAGVVQALAHDHRRGAGRPAPAATAGDARGRVRAAPLPGSRPRLHRVRGCRPRRRKRRRRRRAGQEDGRLPPVPRGRDGGGRDPAGGGASAGGLRPDGSRGAGPLRIRPHPRRRAGRPAHRRRLAHPGLGQEPDHGLLRGAHRPRAGDGESHRRRADRPKRPRRPALRHLRALRRPAAPASRAGGEPGGPARPARRGIRRRGVHHHPEVLPGGRG